MHWKPSKCGHIHKNFRMGEKLWCRYATACGPREELELTYMQRMPMRNLFTEEELRDVRSLIPDDLVGYTYIAGGSVINPKAADIDVWVTAGTKREEWGQRLLHHVTSVVHTSGRQRSDCAEWTYKIKGVDKLLEYYDPRMWNNKQHGLENIPGKTHQRKIQIMVVEFADIKPLLDTFDISVHAWAMSLAAPDIEIRGPRATTIYDQPRVQDFDTPHSTLRRYITICDRYGHKLNWEDVERLAEEVNKRAKERAANAMADLGLKA